MTGALPHRAAAFLRRAGLLAGLLAIIAGILGMHIMTGSHGMPAAATSLGTDMAQDGQASVAVAAAPGGAAAQSTPAPQSPPSMSGRSCADAGVCATMSAMDAVCIPSPGNPPLTVPLPGVTPFAATVPPTLPAGFSPYAYLPGSPSPGDLCISRT
ncbi:hypothetical protein [Arthrobacter sp. H16F315]|uniref:hypothetical protein n=1 Tax=Arthrobacter sp. H16F315 TaxID=2955314 RepID=UPI002097353C|nr:hypothetical protein [Arthrobacter sp. H16F315]MDD1478586.1 hypothetical protein [Arthrobacter sp. H16F315]